MKSALLLLAVAAGGCAENDLSLSIIQMEALKAPDCTAMNTVGTSIDRGILDVSQAILQGYVAVPLVRNNQQTRITAAGGVEYNSIQLTGARVTLQLPPPLQGVLTADETDFKWPSAAGRVDPQQAAPMFVEVIPAQIAAKLAGKVPQNSLITVITVIRPLGTATSDNVTGGPVPFPVDLCSGCLQLKLGPCPLPAGTKPAGTGCFPQQDTQAGCCIDPATNEPLCGANAPIAMTTP